ncbi:integron integrase [Thiomicrorhabdus indica]|uniref:integron integrase n=1 Tax=Thiomicrorhabdus indica TaxID=2267253 RepID=UPI0013EE7B56|nr:integron integrase [Thiomicrorhabdus indica]
MNTTASKSLLLDEMRITLRREAMLQDSSGKVEQFLTYLAVDQNVAPSTQNQALNALSFCYTKVLNAPFINVKASRSRKEPRIPVVLTKEEVAEILTVMEGSAGLIAKLLYAGGLRISEAIRLRVQDIDFGFKQITVRDGKGKKDRVTPLANNLIPLLETQLQKVKTLHQQDLNQGYGSVYLPYALAKKYPNAEFELGWQYVFPSNRLAEDPRSGKIRRQHSDQSVINKAIKKAVKQCRINKKVSAHTFRHSFMKYIHVFHPLGQTLSVQI